LQLLTFFQLEEKLGRCHHRQFQKELGAMGYKYQFITLAGIHSMWYNMFDLAQAYVQRGMSAYVELSQMGPLGLMTKELLLLRLPAVLRRAFLKKYWPPM